MKSHWLFTAVLLGLGAGACSSSGSSAVSVAGACQAFSVAATGYVQRCTRPAPSTFSRSVEACELRLKAAGNASSLAGQLQQCADAVNTAMPGCDGLTDAPECWVLPPGTFAIGTTCGEGSQCESGYCKETASGLTSVRDCGVCSATVADGQPCSPADHCALGSACILEANADVGTCRPDQVGDVGATCASYMDCSASLRCDLTSKRCAERRDAGAACDFSGDCKQSLVCNGGICGQGLAEGAACSPTAQCAPALTCWGAVNATCVATKYVGPGETCNAGTGVFCQIGPCPVTQGPGSCPKVIPNGQPCVESANDTTCDLDAFCIGGTCQMLDPGLCK
jgi:hypothetical protein